MEADDDFGDLYSDVLLPVASDPAKPPSPPSNPNSNPRPAATAPESTNAGDEDDGWILGGDASPTVDPTSNWADDDEEINMNPSKNENPRVSVSLPDQTIPGNSMAVTADVVDQEELPTSIPGLDASMRRAASHWDDSDSEDDLKIVLNDTEHGAMDEMMYGEEDGDEEEDLVILTNDDQIGALDQDWGEEGSGQAGEGEGKEGEGGKGAGAGGASAPGPSRVGYSNHGFHSHHSTYKYVRPGAPVPGGPGPQGQLRPPLPAGPYPGRGRGDWRPPGFRGFNSWANQNRPAGLDFSLPPQKTIFDFEIDSFEEKPWKYPGADLSDFFNFGMDEEKWKDYCKRLGQLKIESTMQSKIRVYESGRSEPEFDPDLPPELAAATGQNEIPSENGAHNVRSNGQVNFNNSQGTGAAGMRPQLPTGRAILVESSYAERLPSMDTRPPRLRESDTIIEIVLQDSFGDYDNNGDVADKTERESRKNAENDDFSPDHHHPRQRSPRRDSSHKRHSSRSTDDTEDSYNNSPKEKEKYKDKEKEKENPAFSREDTDIQMDTQEAATKDPSVDNQSEQLVYSEPEEVNSVDQGEEEESQSSLREREESCQRVATRSETSHAHSRSERDDELAQEKLLPKSSRVSRKDLRVGSFNNHHNNGMKWRGGDEMKWRGSDDMKWRGSDEMYYQQPQPHYMHAARERDFVPHAHGFRGRSFERFRGFREEDEMRVGSKGMRVYEREDDGFRVRKRAEEEEWRGVRERERDDFVDAHMKRRKDEERRGKVEREDVMMMERKRERDRERDESSGHTIRVKDKRHRDREERERQKAKQIHEREESRGPIRTSHNNRNGSTSRDEAKHEERERKLRDKLFLNSNSNNINSNNLERSSSRHERDRYRDGTRRSRAGTDTITDQRNTKRRREDHKLSEQENLKKVPERSRADVDPILDEEIEDDDSRRGRSKLERWTSHKERDYTAISTSIHAQDSNPKLNVSSSNANGEDAAGQAHLDTVERLKRRSERFKVPLHGEKGKEREKEREGESEPTGGQSQLEVKPERPTRKRRWTGS